ncbi:STAS domain-containing protein [Actinoplanes sp. NBC_00393]|uniref:STAS domain-containing protein n=1 Tax=Actinoplanes sp. NBC_00393 TaxID=2975953 RepID=UPI002E1C3F57
MVEPHEYDVTSGPVPLRISVSSHPTGTITLRLAGDLDYGTASQLAGSVEQQLSSHPARLCIDLDGVAFLDAAGVRVLLQCRARADDARCRLQASSPQPLVHQVLHIIGLTEGFGLPAPQGHAWQRSRTRPPRRPLPPTSAADTIEVARALIAEARALRRQSQAVCAAVAVLAARQGGGVAVRAI